MMMLISFSVARRQTLMWNRDRPSIRIGVQTFVVIANEALEDHEGSAGGVGHVGTEGREVEGSVLDREHEIYE